MKGIANITHGIEGYIEKSCEIIFRTYLEELVKQPKSYIMYSVWGMSAEGELRNIQKAINAMLQPTVEQIFQSLSLEDLNLGKKVRIEYLIRGLIISRLFFMVELFKTTVRKRDTPAHLSEYPDLIHSTPDMQPSPMAAKSSLLDKIPRLAMSRDYGS